MEPACAGDAGVNTKSPLPPVAYRLKYAREETPASDEVDGLRGWFVPWQIVPDPLFLCQLLILLAIIGVFFAFCLFDKKVKNQC